jgi:hypothetical protein
MRHITIPASAFNRCFEQFKQYVRSKGGEFRDFSSGLLYDWEFYKTRVHDRALQKLDVPSWKANEVGSGVILDRVISAI